MPHDHTVRRPSDCSNVHHGCQEKLCRRSGHALRASSHRGKQKTIVVVLGSRAITSSKQCRAVHSCTSAIPTRLCTRGRDKRVTGQCATPLLLYLRTTARHQRAMVDFSVANEKQVIIISFFELIIFHFFVHFHPFIRQNQQEKENDHHFHLNVLVTRAHQISKSNSSLVAGNVKFTSTVFV